LELTPTNNMQKLQLIYPASKSLITQGFSENANISYARDGLIGHTEIDRQDQEIRNLNHSLKNVEASQQMTADVKRVEVETAKVELHKSVDENIDKLTP